MLSTRVGGLTKKGPVLKVAESTSRAIMAISEVNINLVDAVQTYRLLFEWPRIPTELVWDLWSRTNEKASFIVGYLNNAILAEVVDVLHYNTLQDTYGELYQDAVTATAI